LATVVTARARVLVVDALGVDVADLLDGQDEPMHGDEVDTSLVLHLAPGLVRPEAARDNMVPREVARRFRAGRRPAAPVAPPTIGRPSLASAAKGARIYARLLERVGTRVLGATPDALRAAAADTFAAAGGIG
jgi:creatinine amidohydrolase